ncbi:MAG: hypothetical protein HDS32_02000 [Bacteroides sp.]|nr:hypothetical protein [Bacteroides sp.]
MVEERNTEIFRRLGLREGKLGEAIAIILDPESDQNERDNGEKILNEVLRDYRKLPKGVSHGRWGLVPAIDILIRAGQVEPGPYWDSLISAQMREMMFLSYGATPVRITAEDDFMAEGVMCVAAYRSYYDSLERMRLLERMIALVDEIEVLLTIDLTPYTGNRRLTPRQLHSILYFILFMSQLKAYPVKTEQVAAMMTRYCGEMDIPDDGDGQLLRHLLGNAPLPVTESDNMRFFFLLYGLDQDDILPESENAIFCDTSWSDLMENETIVPIDHSSDCMAIADKLTILMTLRVDSAERLRNYKACVSFLLRTTDVRIIVTEADSSPLGNIFPDEKRVEYHFTEDLNPIFHRTHYMNRMLRECPTPFAALWDIDAIGDPKALATCLDAISSHDAVMAYPYNGRFWSVTDFFSEAFARTLDLRTLTELPQPRYLMAGYHSVGGAFVVDVARYRSLGWENANFNGWGPEDMERYRRLEILGHRPLRIDADLYHLSHPRGINSCSSDPSLARSTKEEFLKVCAMTPERLREYLNTWAWTR